MGDSCEGNDGEEGDGGLKEERNGGREVSETEEDARRKDREKDEECEREGGEGEK